MNPSRAKRNLCCAGTALALTACGGGTATIGGTVSGLGAGLSLVLQNNGAENLSLTANGAFTFATSTTTYSVTVLTQPVGQTCAVANATGTVNSVGDPVTSVAVTCASNASVGGTVTGLPTGAAVTLSLDGTLLPIAANGAYAFPGLLTAGSAYNVTVATQPAGATCTLSNPSGRVVAGEMAVVNVTCR